MTGNLPVAAGVVTRQLAPSKDSVAMTILPVQSPQDDSGRSGRVLRRHPCPSTAAERSVGGLPAAVLRSPAQESLVAKPGHHRHKAQWRGLIVAFRSAKVAFSRVFAERKTTMEVRTMLESTPLGTRPMGAVALVADCFVVSKPVHRWHEASGVSGPNRPCVGRAQV